MAESPTQKLDADHKGGAHEVPSIHEAPAAVLEEGSLDPVYEAKAKILNKAIQDIGMGKYQWQVNIHIRPSHLASRDAVDFFNLTHNSSFSSPLSSKHISSINLQYQIITP